MFDLKEMETADTAEMVVLHPATGEPTNWTITFAGPGHPQTIEAATRATKRRLDEERRREQAQVNGRKYRPDDRTPDDLRAENVRFVVERMLGWGPVKIEGVDYPFTPENATALLLNPKMSRLYGQCIDFLAADDSFTGGSAKTSSPSPSTTSV